MLHTIVHGEDTAAPPLLIVPGLFGSARNWGVIARNLSARRKVIAVDQRNHGNSPWFDSHTYPEMAADLAEVIGAEGRACDVLGHSMGGKAAMMLALTRPERIRRLVVLDIAPYAYGHSQSGLIDAMEAVDLDGLRLRSEAEAQLAREIPEPGVRAFLLQSLDLKSAPPRWKFNLRALRDQMPLLVGWPADAPQGSFTGPALFLAGAQSDYCREPQVQAIRAAFPQAQIRIMAGAGHWLHADRPAEVAEMVTTFLG